MSRRLKALLAFVALLVGLGASAALHGFRPTTHPTVSARFGSASSTTALEAVLDQPGPIRVESVVGADWEVERAGLVNLDHPRARAAGLAKGLEPVQILFHALHHPERGLFLIDTGVERALRDAPERAVIRGAVAKVMNADKMHVRTDTASFLSRQREPVAGVLFTHLHLDHVSGLPDVSRGTPLYAGPGETRDRAFLNLFVQPIVDRAFAGHGPLRELEFQPDPSGAFAGVLDLLGDGSLFALLSPGHTSGSTAYLARTDGPVLFVGDACHTAWGWENGVEPGEFSHDRERSVESLARLQRFVAKHPAVRVRLGHQSLGREEDLAGR